MLEWCFVLLLILQLSHAMLCDYQAKRQLVPATVPRVMVRVTPRCWDADPATLVGTECTASVCAGRADRLDSARSVRSPRGSRSATRRVARCVRCGPRELICVPRRTADSAQRRLSGPRIVQELKRYLLRDWGEGAG